MRVLYVSYDGALDPLGASQVVPYVVGLQRRGYAMTLMTFEKRERWADEPRRQALQRELREAGVTWLPQRYHAGLSLLTTSADLLLGYGVARQVGPFALVHARSYPSALLASRLAASWRVPWIFDVRGFYPEERVDGGLWSARGPLFRLTKRLERTFDRQSAAIVTLTQASVAILNERVRRAGGQARVTVIPTCTDLQRFTPHLREVGHFTLAYVGSLGTWYLVDEMLRFARIAQQSSRDVRIRFVTNDPVERVQALAQRAGLDPARVSVANVPHERVPVAIGGASATFFFIRAAFSKIASAATKFGESLALGLPVVINPGVGDSQALVERHGVGVVVPTFSEAAMQQAVHDIRVMAARDEMRDRCRRVADEVFSLERGVQAYAELYDRLGAH